MWEVLFWVYLANAVLVITHEIDSAYWREWELFRLPWGLGGFLVVHLPLLFLILYGLVLVDRQTTAGLVLSLILSCGGLFAFGIHTYYLRQGRKEFRQPVSLALLITTLGASLAQGVITLLVML
jgi:hypothetical protein